jgi:hypothetical protein
MNRIVIAQELVKLAKELTAEVDARKVKQKSLPLVIGKDFYMREGERNVVRPEYRKALHEHELKRLQNRIKQAEEDDEAGLHVNKRMWEQDKKSLKYLRSINWWEMGK